MKNVGTLQIQKGTNDQGIQIAMWDAIPNCTEDCPIYETCPYDGSRRLCEMRRRYLESICTSLEKAIEEKNDMNMLQMGMMLIPLFAQLVTYKIYIHSLQHKVMFGKSVHPVMKEMKTTITQINSLLKDMNLTGVKGLADPNQNGQSDYYEKMLNQGVVPK